MSYGETIAQVYRACAVCEVQPTALDLGFHDSGEAVVAISFAADRLPNALDLQDALRAAWSGVRVTIATEQGETERTLLLFLGVQTDQDVHEDELQEA